MRKLLCASAAFVSLVFTGYGTHSATAALVSTFAQNSTSNTVTATNNGGGTATNISVSGASTDIAVLLDNAPVPNAFFSLAANSIDAATTVLGAIIQHYSGTFCLTASAGCGGTNYLSGTFTDAAFGAGGGPGLVLNVNAPPDTLSLTSSVIAASKLLAPDSFSLSFADITSPPGLHITGSTIASFTAGFSGVVSASPAQGVAEPLGIAVLGAGILGLGLARRRRPDGGEMTV